MQSEKKRKILFILHSLDAGGAERLVLDLATKLKSSRFQVFIICMSHRGELYEEIKEKGISVFEMNKKARFDPLAIYRLFRLVKTIQPDVVHTHLRAGDLWGRLIAVFCGVRCIISTEHNLNTVDTWFDRMHKTLLNYWTHKVIFISKAVAGYYLQRIPLPSGKTQIISNGVDVARFFTERRILEKPRVRILVVARLVEQKGHEYLLAALDKIRDKGWECLFVGKGEKQGKLQAMARRLSLQDRVHFFGVRLDIPDLLQSSDIFVLPSIFEGQGIVLLEAGVAGACLVASDVDGIKDIIEHEKTGFLAPAKDVERLASVLRWILEHRAAANVIAERGQQFIVEHFDIKETIRKYEEVYENSPNQ